VDSADDTPGYWAVYRRTPTGWTQVRRENRKINSDLITNAAIFDSKENQLRMVLQLYDPYKGYIPGVADRELAYKTFNDPATYNTGRLVWGKEQVGNLWWDLSAVRYLDYEIYDRWNGTNHEGTNYRWKNWGRVAPNSKVDIYQWTRSPVAPNAWAQYVESQANLKIDNKPSGTVEETTRFVTDIEWNDEIQVDETIYYFWVKNPTVVPTLPFRKLSAQQISNILSNPTANDIPFFAVVDENKCIVGGIKQFLNETDTVLKIKWKQETEIHNNHHKQWMMLREADERNTIDDQLWNKMRDSIVGWDATEKSVPDERLPKPQQIGALIRPRQSWYPADPTPTGQRASRSARKAFVDAINDVLSEQPFIDQWVGWEQVFATGESLPAADRYITTALDLVDLRNLLPASRNMVQIGECVLIENTVEAAGFWTLWKLVEISGQRTFILEDFQKWRMQEGELWNLADWYADGWSAGDFPNYRFPDNAARNAAGNLDVTLLKGTLVQIDTQSPTDDRWSWDVYTSTTKFQVAKARSTMRLNDAFYEDSRVEFGPKEVSDLLNTSEASRITPDRIQDLADIINFRDGSREIEYMLNVLRTELFDSLQKNSLFFAMVKSAFRQSLVVDWAFKTSFLYLGGYSETLRQSPVAFKDQIDNVIAYLEEVKPYHVKIREYVRRLSSGPDIANVLMTDFDKPVFPEGTSNRVLNVTNSTDESIMRINRPWRDWFENYQNENRDLDNWDANWNGVRRMNVTMKFDRVSCGTVVGWDTAPWEPSLFIFSQLGNVVQNLSELNQLYRNGPAPGANYYRDQTVESIEERNLLVRRNIVTPDRPGTIVKVLRTNENFMWSGSDWIQFDALGWDEYPDMGTASRVETSYRPLPGMKRRDDPGLIAGCDFTGSVITDTFQKDAWDIFEWDSTGYTQGIRERAGFDQDSIDGNTTEADEADPAYFGTTGNEFSQPAVNGDRPHELVQIRGMESLVINVERENQPYQKSFMNHRGMWQDIIVANTSMTFSGWDQTAHTLSIDVSNWAEDAEGYTPLHDPQNPSTGFVRDVMASKAYRSTSSVDMTTMGTKTFKLRDLSQVDGIPAGLRGDGVRVIVTDPKNPSVRAIGTLQNSRGSETNWNGSIEITFDSDGFVNLGSGKKWNIIPVDIFNEPGIVWIGDARFTYNSITRNGNSLTLNDAYLSGTSLAPLTIDETSVELTDTSLVFDGSKQRQIAR